MKIRNRLALVPGGDPRGISAAELQSYLHSHIPLTRAMQVSVLEVSPQSVRLAAPLAPNLNHRETAFGGSIASLATLAAWSLVHTRLQGEGLSSRVVIQRNTMSFDTPVAAEFSAASAFVDEDAWPRLLRMLERRGIGRIAVKAEVRSTEQLVGRFEGEFVALGS